MKINYKEIVDFLIKEFPEFKDTEEFKSYDEEDLKLPYIIMASFARYAIDRLKKNCEDDLELKKLFEFINEQYSDPNSDPELLNLISVEVFENFAQEKETLEFSRKSTKGKARHAVEMSLAYSGVDKPDLTLAPEAKTLIKSIDDFNKKQSEDSK